MQYHISAAMKRQTLLLKSSHSKQFLCMYYIRLNLEVTCMFELHIYSLHFLELVLNIYVPTKQNNLKSGRAQLRIRNTGFTITTCDNPPRCQGTWQIIHIRKYGGSESFRFQTGMCNNNIQILATFLLQIRYLCLFDMHSL